MSADKRKRLRVAVGCAAVAAAVVFVIWGLHQHKERETAEAYWRINITLNSTEDRNGEQYLPFVPETRTPDGVWAALYLYMEYYRQQTRSELSYEDAVSYFDSEYETDGSLRLYNNGLHPEIEAYVDWCFDHYEEQDKYTSKIDGVFSDYYYEHRAAGFESSPLYEWSRTMLDELIKKDLNPDYELDLMSIQRREKA